MELDRAARRFLEKLWRRCAKRGRISHCNKTTHSPLLPDAVMSERDIFTAALQIADPAERSAYLGQACTGDAALRQRVEMLLGTHGSAGDFLERPAVDQMVSGPATESAFVRPARRGPSRGNPRERTARRATTWPSSPRRRSPAALGRLGHYEVLEVVGHGGFGMVFQAFDEKLHRVVAIKVLSPQPGGSGTARKRFIREAQAAAAVRHDHVVTIHAVEEVGRPLPGHGVRRRHLAAGEARPKRARWR